MSDTEKLADANLTVGRRIDADIHEALAKLIADRLDNDAE